jgi:hypothetical protein
MGPEELDRAPDGSGLEGIVGIQPDQNFTAGRREPLVNRVRRTCVARTGKPQPIAVAFQDFERAIGGASIHYDEFDRRIVLAEDALDRQGKELLHVVGRSHYRDEWFVAGDRSLGSRLGNGLRRRDRIAVHNRLRTRGRIVARC